MRSRLCDEFYGQWLLLNVPFRNVNDFWVAELEWIPPEHWNIAMCFYSPDERAQAMWAEGNEDAIAAEMRVEGY
eukprot:6274799-Karenia_brevis.AAC.1